MRIIKHETKDKFCVNQRIQDLITQKANDCINRAYSNLQKNTTLPDYFYDNKDDIDGIRGVYQVYNYEGISREINVIDPIKFYNSFNDLIKSEWITKYNYFVIFEINLYAINEKKYFQLQIYFEYSNNIYIQKEIIKILNGSDLGYLLNFICLLLSILMIFMEFLALKKSAKNNEPEEYNGNCFIRMIKYYNRHFERPGMFEYIGILF
jgi:hypothetical protein